MQVLTLDANINCCAWYNCFEFLLNLKAITDSKENNKLSTAILSTSSSGLSLSVVSKDKHF